MLTLEHLVHLIRPLDEPAMQLAAIISMACSNRWEA